jgi:hypothetical protein
MNSPKKSAKKYPPALKTLCGEHPFLDEKDEDDVATAEYDAFDEQLVTGRGRKAVGS